MSRPTYWSGVAIKTRDGQAHCLSYEQGRMMVSALQTQLDELRKQYAEDRSIHVVDRIHELVDLLQWLKPGRDSRFGSHMRAYRSARYKARP